MNKKELSNKIRLAKIDMMYHKKQMEYHKEVIKILEKKVKR